MSGNHDKQYYSISECPFELGYVENEEAADRQEVSSLTQKNDLRVECVRSASNAVVRLQPMKVLKRDRDSPRWEGQSHFNAELKIPTSSTNGSFCFQVHARAREGLAFALSPKQGFVVGDTYEIIIGDNGNTTVTLQRKSSSKENGTLLVRRPARVCQETAWTHYWVCLCEGKLFVGIGDTPGDKCLVLLDDIARQDQPPPDERAVRYIGVGNAGKGDRHPPVALKVRNLRVFSLTETIAVKLRRIEEKDLEFIALDEDEMDDETRGLLHDYEKECSRARARAEKFGLPYKDPVSFIPWSQARKLKANPQHGFVTGFDLTDPKEVAKQDARRKRFGLVGAIEGSELDVEPTDPSPRIVENEDKSELPIEQACYNEELVKTQRKDPPAHLWKIQPENSEAPPNGQGTVLTPEKIHLFSIDWAAFKQIRTNDVMKYFSSYGPTYVEWLGDFSCNICFQDMHSAARALNNLSAEIPSPPPAGDEETRDESSIRVHADLGRMGWRFGKTLLRKIANDRYGRRGTKARILLRVASSLDILHERPSSWPKPPEGFSTKAVLGPNIVSKEHGGIGRTKKRQRENGETQLQPDLNKNGEPSLLDRGLASTRKGFSVEDLEEERARKRR